MQTKVVFLVLVLLCGARRVEAACTGAAQSWTCSAETTAAEVKAALANAGDGATLTFGAGSYTWNTAIDLSNSRGVTLLCAAPGSCTVNVRTGTAIQLDTLSGTNTKLYRISGFVFQNAPDSALVLWFWGPGTLTQVRIDHNVFRDFGDGAIAIAFGEVGTIGAYYGLLDHNTVTGTKNFMLVHMMGKLNPIPPASARGTANNLFVEDNTMTFAANTNAGLGCADGWGGNAIVWRHNTTTNCMVTSHGVVHNGGPFNFELYGNSLNANAGAEGFEDCYRCFHHQGSGELIAFDNTFSATGGKNADPLEVTHYRSAPAMEAGYGDPPGRCDGSKAVDGNRAPASTYLGYPCWRQPGRDGAGNLAPMYAWNNRWSDTGGKIDLRVENPWGATSPSVATHVAKDRDFYNAVSATPQTGPSTPFDGASGMGFGTLANRPTTCTTNPNEPGGGVGYFANDDGQQGTLYRCAATNTWTVHYAPYPYPHPLQGPASGAPDAGATADATVSDAAGATKSAGGCGCSVGDERGGRSVWGGLFGLLGPLAILAATSRRRRC